MSLKDAEEDSLLSATCAVMPKFTPILHDIIKIKDNRQLLTPLNTPELLGDTCNLVRYEALQPTNQPTNQSFVINFSPKYN